jgi:septal ring factor EnvC (AmiA/AmiB activator)
MLVGNSTETVIPLSSTDEGGPDQLDATGHSILQLIGKAAGIAEEYTRHALMAAEKLAHELRAAKDRIAKLEDELAASNDRADRAEQWLNKIRKEIDQKFVQQIDRRR